MYIHKKYSINETNNDVKEYKTALKELTNMNLRRSSKLNVLALLGSLNCLKDTTLSNNTGLYVCSEYGSILSTKKVLEEVSSDSMIMPFDFLNINSNNVSFYVSQALKVSGKNMLLTSEDLSFEKGLELAIFDLSINEVDDVLIGKVDESLSDINDYNEYISNLDKLPSNDYSGWLYINKVEENALCKIEFIKSYNTKEQLKKIVDSLDYDIVFLNQFAKKNINDLSIENSIISLENELNVLEYIIKYISNESKNMTYIAQDKNGKGYVVYISK